MVRDLITQMIKSAMKAKDAKLLEALRGIKTAFANLEIEKGKDNLTETDYLMLLKKLAKQREDSAKQYTVAGREDLAAIEAFELGVIDSLLPKNLSDEEVEELVVTTAKELNLEFVKPNMGTIVKSVVSAAQGRTDGKTVSTIVSRIIMAQ